MQTVLEKLRSILSEKISEERVQALISELTIAIGANSVAIASNAPGAVTITGNQSFVGNNNHITIYENTNPDEIIEKIRSLLQSLQLESAQISLLGIDSKFKNANRRFIILQCHGRGSVDYLASVINAYRHFIILQVIAFTTFFVRFVVINAYWHFIILQGSS